MSLNRYAVRRDLTEKSIVQALEAIGAKVLRLDEVDMLVLFQGRISLLEAKTGNGRWTASQQRLRAAGWPLQRVTTALEALSVIGATPKIVPAVCKREESA